MVDDLYPGFEFEMLLYTLSETDGACRLEWLLRVNIYYRHNGASDHMDVLSKDGYTLFDERNGIYLDQRIETSHTYRCHLNDQMFVLYRFLRTAKIMKKFVPSYLITLRKSRKL